MDVSGEWLGGCPDVWVALTGTVDVPQYQKSHIITGACSFSAPEVSEFFIFTNCTNNLTLENPGSRVDAGMYVRRAMKRLFDLVVSASALFVSGPLLAEANDRPKWMYVQSAHSVTVSGASLSLPIEKEIFGFCDGVRRSHGYLSADEYVSLLKDAAASEATLTWVANNELQRADVDVLGAQLDPSGEAITYTLADGASIALPDAVASVSLLVRRDA